PRMSPLTQPPSNQEATTQQPREALPDWLWRRGVDFLPLVLALALALGTFWLVKSMPKAERAEAKPVSKEPDLYMRGFEMQRYGPNGQLQFQLTGAYGDHLPETDSLRIQNAKTWSVDEQGATTQGQANRALSDRKGMNVELFEQVRIEHQAAAKPGQATPPAPTIFESEYLKSTNRQEHISTDKPVTVTQGGSTLTGTGLQYTHSTRVVEVQGRVKAMIPPNASTPKP
ncbi:MAG: LPS export ABC transporter periplasmic protein LptC, partial [Brachymonas sp.]|nr:LPS export ABC transporter periplasmic protein LptC [Brachymonas sp.]